MSTTKRPTRNLTAGDLQLQDIGQISAAIDRAIADLWALEAERAEAVAQRDELLEALKELLPVAVAAIAFVDCKASVEKAERAILRAAGQK